MAWTTTAGVKAALGYSGTDRDSQIAALIPLVQDLLEAKIGRKIEMAEYTEQYDGNGSRFLVLRNRPVYSVTSIKDSLQRNFADTAAISPQAYAVRPDSGKVVLDNFSGVAFITGLQAGVFTRGTMNVQVVYRAGYGDPATYPSFVDSVGQTWPAAEPVPPSLVYALSLVVWATINTGSYAGMTSVAIGQARYTMADAEKGLGAVAPQVSAALDAFTNRSEAL